MNIGKLGLVGCLIASWRSLFGDSLALPAVRAAWHGNKVKCVMLLAVSLFFHLLVCW